MAHQNNGVGMSNSSNIEIGFFETIESTRAIRNFKPDPIPDNLLRKVLSSAGQAPSGGNRQPWRWVVIRSTEGKAEISRLVYQAGQMAEAARRDGKDKRPRPANATESKEFHEVLLHVPVIIIACAQRPVSEGPHTVGPFGQTYPAIQNLLLAARALGLGGTITTNFRYMEKEFRNYLSLPDNIDPTCLIPLGYPANTGRDRHGSKTREAVEKIAFEEYWGQEISF